MQHADHQKTRVRGVFLGPVEVAGYFARLRIGLRELDIHCEYVDLADHPFNYVEAPRAGLLVRMARIGADRTDRPRSRVSRAWRKPISVGARLALLARAIATCDAFIFGSGHTLFGLRELPLLRLLGKRIVVVFFGSEARPSYLDGIEARRDGATADSLVAVTREKRSRLRRLTRHAHVVVSHGPISHLLDVPFVRWLDVGIPVTDGGKEHEDAGPSDPPVFLHAPSHRGAKGTDVIRATVERLRADGVELDYRELHGVGNTQVQREIAAADVVVDQLYSDTPMAVLASEAAVAGKPTVVGCLDWEGALHGVDPSALPPTIRCAPEELDDVLRRLAADASRHEIGDRARAFVRERWRPSAVAQRFVTLIVGEIPAQWYESPSEIRYVSGSGLTREDLAATLTAVGAIGDDPFALADKPGLEARLRHLVSSTAGPRGVE